MHGFVVMGVGMMDDIVLGVFGPKEEHEAFQLARTITTDEMEEIANRAYGRAVLSFLSIEIVEVRFGRPYTVRFVRDV